MPAELPFSPWVNEHPESFLATVLGFLLLAFVLGRFNIPSLSLPYMRGVLNERAGRIEEAHRQVNNALEDTQRLRDGYAARLQRIEIEAREHIDAALREAEAARAEIIAEAQQTAIAVRRRTEEEIARETTRMRILLRQQIVQIALDAAEQSVRVHSTENVQRKLISDFISRAAARGGATIAAPKPASAPDGFLPTQTQSQTQKSPPERGA